MVKIITGSKKSTGLHYNAMPLIDSDSKLLFFLCIVLVTTLVTLSKFVFFTFDYYYTIRQMIFSVIKQLTSNDSAERGWSDPTTETNAAYDADIEKDFDTHVVNLLRYLENNQDSNKRLDQVDAESSRYISYHNYMMIVRFFTVIFLLTLAAGMASHYKYGSFLTQFWSALKTQ